MSSRCATDPCVDCPYQPASGRRKFVPSNLPHEGSYDLLIIGEAPGADEVQKGEPFIGESGRMIRSALSICGLHSEAKVGFGNASGCPTPEAQKQRPRSHLVCRNRLLEEVEQSQPRVILALGNWALRSLTNDWSLKITQENGILRQWNGSKLIPALHPAGVMRNPGNYTQFRQAVQLAVNEVRGVGRRDPGQVSFFVANSPEKVKKAFDKLWTLPWNHLVGADIETTGFSPFRDRIKCMGIAYEHNKVIILPEEFFGRVDYRKWLELLMRSRRLRWGWHGGKFDVKHLRQIGIPARIDEDSMLAHYTLEEQRGTHSLEQLSSTILGAPPYKGAIEQGRKNGWIGTPRTDLFRYQAEDADYTRQLFAPLHDQMEQSEGLLDLYYGILIPAANFLANVELRGMPFSVQAAREVAEQKMPEWTEKKAEFNRLIAEYWPQSPEFKRTGASPPIINPNSSIQVGKLIYDWFQFPVPKGFKRDTQKETLTAMGHHPMLKALLDSKKIGKTLSTYCGYIGPKGDHIKGLQRVMEPQTQRIHTTLNLHISKTGRLTSVDPNLQNITRGPLLRGMFIMPDGRYLLEADLKSAEIVVLANLSKDPELCRILNDGLNLHHEVAVAMFGENYTEDEYFRAKAYNFGIMYGRTPASLVKEFGHQGIEPDKRLKLPQATRLREIWLGRFPVSAEYIEYLRAAPGNGANLKAPTGRRRRFGAVNDRTLHEAENEAANFPIQGPASDIVLLASTRNERFAASHDCWAMLLIHDAVYYDCPSEDAAREVAKAIAYHFKTVGEEFLGKAVPFKAEFKFGTRWGHTEKRKDFETTPTQCDSKTYGRLSTISEAKLGRQLSQRARLLTEWVAL